MNKTKRVLSVVLAVLMLSSLIAALAIADNETCNVEIKYVFANSSKQAAQSWTAKIAKGTALNTSVTSPAVVGYTPREVTVTFNETVVNDNITRIVYYDPADVGFTIRHYWQNVEDDNYTLHETEKRELGKTESQVGTDLAKDYTGFMARLYDTTTKIAADGSTVVEIYYDRNLYLMSFNLDGGYGVEPIYARYGAALEVGTPTKPGYTFSGWEPQVPATVPAENTTYKAKWQAEKTAKVTVVVWGENADDENYSYIKSVETTAPVGSTLTAIPSGTNLNMGTKLWELKRVEQTTVAADGSSVLNVYYDRKEFTLTFKYDYHSGFLGIGEGYKKTGTITAKWDADIGAKFLAMNTAAKGSQWSRNENGKDPWTAFLQIMPAENRTYYCQNTSNTAQSAYYYTEGLDGKYVLKHTVNAYYKNSLYISSEDFYPMEGFTYDHGFDGDDDELPSPDDIDDDTNVAYPWSGAKFYYKRNSYDLVFISNNTEVKTSKVKFEAALGTSNGESFAPSYPSNFEPNAFEFAGWYQDPEGVKPVDWNAKMPAASVTVYAKWAPVQHTVKTWLTDKMDTPINVGDTGSNEQIVNHRETATAPANPTNAPLTFVGWFYMDGTTERAFDFSMPVTRDLELYAKWSSDVMVQYTVRYRLNSEDGTDVADETVGSAPAGTTRTFEAKGGNDLYADYRTGCFPTTNSHSIKMDVDETKNIFTFVYVPKASVRYTVQYREEGNLEHKLHEDKVVDSKDAIVTETFVPVTGYAPRQFQIRLVLSAEGENVITFLYYKNTTNAPVLTIHWIENITGDGYEQYQSSTNMNAVIGVEQTSTALDISGFTYAHGTAFAGSEQVGGEFNAPATPKATLTNKGLTLNLYYTRNDISYTVKHVYLNGTTEEVLKTEPKSAKYEEMVTESAEEYIGDYKHDENDLSQKDLIIGLNPDENVITFYYYPCYYIGHVQGTNVRIEPKRLYPGAKASLTDAVTPGYLYGGAFTDVACDADHVQTFTLGETAINFTPVKGEKYYIWEVSETYLKPRAYVVSRHDPNAKPDANGSTLNVVGLYLTSSVDRNMYSEVGFTVDRTNFASDGGKVYDKVQAVYTDGSGVKEEMYVTAEGVWDVQAQAPAPASRGGYVSICTVSMDTFYKKSAESPLSYQPYWVTLDGIKVTGAYAARTCYYQGVGNGDIGISNCVDSNSAVSIYRAATTNTIGVESVAVLSAAPETVQPEVPVTPEIPEVPEAPEMTLNSDAMYLRAQYTYEMMTNTVRFISAIDVNECTEYGFVINGEVVKCEEAAETVDGYDANYLFGGSVNGAMLMSCNMLLDGLVDGMTLNVTPYYVALDGTTVVYGETRTLVYRQWVGLEG
ncbi:MAG: InlB B-repeat-containing protein [Christensenellaceae bacterium]|nr:InlB B-repeat-containing protein [Christensenellaceae bacterium]